MSYCWLVPFFLEYNVPISYLCHLCHHIWNRAMALALVERGHNVTMIGHDNETKKTANFNIILFENVYEKLNSDYKYEDMFDQYPIIWIKYVFSCIERACIFDMKTEGFKTILNYPNNTFDLILFDATFGQCLYPIIDYFNVPVIAVTPFLLPNYLSNAMGNHWYTSYMPHYGIPATDRMHFTERVTSFFFNHLEMFIRRFYYMGKFERLAESYFGNKMRPLVEYEKEFTLLLCNTDPILDFPIALPPNIIPVGGLHIQPAKSLPNELEQIMNNAKAGVILFSLGSNLRSDLLPKDMRATLINVFEKLNQTVLWKFETTLVGLPENIIIKKWLPQNDILGHKNIKLFISHGGALSTQEAMYHGVPVLGIPFFSDQHNNIGKLEARKLALSISHQKITTDDFYNKINELVNNPVFSNNMKVISKKFKNQPQTASQRAVFWIEHVLHHGPLDEFSIPNRNMYFFEIYSLDVLALFACLLAGFLIISSKLYKSIS